MSRATEQGLEAGDVGTVEAVRRKRTTTGTSVTVTIRMGQRQIDVQNPAALLQPARVEAYGVRGLQNRPWRRTFANAEELTAWCEKHDAAVLGQRYVEGT